ncbi:MAG: hypothetical protein ACRC0S_08335 [Fusobacteriaceae bacterium]
MDEIEKIYEEGLKKISRDERELFRIISRETLKKLSEELQNRIFDFEKRILETEINTKRTVEIVTFLVSRKNYYLYEDKFSPILKEENYTDDFLENTDILEYRNIFLNIPYDEIEKYNDYKINGTIKTKDKDYSVVFRMENMEKQYEEQVRKLYDVLCINNTKYRTCNIPDSKRAFKIILDEAYEELKEELKGIEIKDVILEKGKLEDKWIEDSILVWNIKENEVISKGEIRPTKNKIHIEHTVYFEKPEDMYLCPTEESEIYYITNLSTGTRIVTSDTKEVKWKFYNIPKIDYRTLKKNEREIFSNRIKPNFLTAYREESTERVRNLGELKRIITSFPDVEKLLDLVDIKILKNYEKEKKCYYINKFIEDEFSLKGKVGYLCLYFNSKEKSNYQIDMLSFIVSEIQLIFPEYECLGEIL